MMSISGVSTGAVQPLTTAERAPGASKGQKPEEEAQNRRLEPATDEYVRSQPREPDQADRGAKGPEEKKDKEEVWEGNSDKADHEIEKLKKKQQELEQRLNTETDEAEIKELERQLAQVERELKQKDNDAYRQQHTKVTRIS